MDNQQHWSDFHFLNSAFVDTVESERTNWIRPSLVRLAYRGNKDRAINRTVRGFDGLIVDYAVPFPLTYIFTPRVLQVYNSVFVFLLQVRRAKSVLERILVRDVITIASQPRTEMKAFYAMRSRLAWFVKCVIFSAPSTC
jgi:gamma-tubulin complex component 5